ncbi:B-cell antigen receptor complex-associated protein beta chain [Microcaecilia unicolor]|uniref:B-cell antigen receptor complex-associated protein beta chain n=1 Tax=Microcaecilia unicolor TaxID=1415580 RepID=A0A6P7ZGL2_9AMPH|nr:B-cell antigen receptor complex-associated protein beta chain [Microcaecilia unicolor]
MPRFVEVSVFCTALTLLGLLTGQNSASECFQNAECQQCPRFIAARRGSTVVFSCICGTSCNLLEIQQISWFEGTERSSTLYKDNSPDPNFHGKVLTSNTTGTVIINKVQQKDSGIYYCKINKTDCGTELKVLGVRSLKSVKTRNTLKDAIIMIQTVLIVLFVSIPVLMILDKNSRSDPMEEDHTYEGLEIEQAPMYEDIVTLRAVESKWTAAEHPCLE